MIGWYIHHVGLGHLHRAEAVSRHLACAVTGLSSLARPRDWRGPWVQLARDDDTTVDPTAGGQLHWAPLHDGGLRTRMGTLSSWINHQRPDLVVSDVSAEVTLLTRLHGVPVVSVVLPGDRSDPAHLLAYRVSDALVATWPREARTVTTGLPGDVAQRIDHVGGLSRHEVSSHRPPVRSPGRVTVLAGAGGTMTRPAQVAAAKREARDWRWTILAPPPVGTWVADPGPVLRGSDVIVTHAGQNAIAETAAVRRPAIVIPEPRPHAEQQATGRALADGPWPVTVLPAWPSSGWPRLLEETSQRDVSTWHSWCDGEAAHRFARVIERTAHRLEAGREAG